MAFERLIVDVSDGIATVTINRPEKLNALDRATVAEIGAAAAELGASSSVRVVVLTGAGKKAFAAGADISEMTDLDPVRARAFSAEGQGVLARLEEMPQPVIAAVNGFALGGGCELALACDIIYSSDRAHFGQPEVNLGVIPGFGGTQRLARRIGAGRALEMICTGNPVGPEEALRIGLCEAVFPAERLMERVRELAVTIASKGPLAVAAAKRVAGRGFAAEAAAFGDLFASADQKEGMRAFLERRKAVFEGK